MAQRGTIDSTLVIRARDEASKAVSAIEAALLDLLDTQKQVASGSQSAATGISQTVTALAGLDRAYTQIAGAADKGVAAFERQLTALAGNQAQLRAHERQLESARAAQERMNAASAKFVGPPTRDAVARYQGVAAEVTNLESSIKGLQRSVAKQESGFTRSASSLGELARQTKLAEAVTTFAVQSSDEYTRSLRQQEAAADRVAQVQAAIARNTERRTGKSAADSSDVFRRAGLTLIERQIAKEEEYAAAVKMTEAAMRARARAEEGLRGTTSFNGKANVGEGNAANTAFAAQLREEEAAAQEAARAEQQLVEAVNKLRAAMNPLAVIQDRLNKELAEAETLYKRGKISATELAAAQKLLKDNADRAAQSLGRQQVGGGKPTLFGLKPYEIQNLGFQVNDIVTQLASGTSLTQTLAQQGGQILQIFPRAGAAIVAALSNPLVLAFAATVGTIVLALKEAGNESDRLRGFLSQLAVSADGSSYGAEQLNAAAEALDRYGLSAEEAVVAVRAFMKEGIDQSRIVEFGRAASDLAEVMGTDLKDAVKEVGEAFTAGYDSIKKLDDAYNFLTATQREQIRTLFEEGRAAEARSVALDIFSGKMDDAADKARGPWADAVRELSGAWQEFLNWLSETGPISSVSNLLAQLGRDAAMAIRRLRGVSNADDLTRQIQASRDMVASIEKQLETAGTFTRGGLEANLRFYKQQLSTQEQQLKALEGQNGELGKQGDTLAKNAERQKKQSEDLARTTAEQKKQKTVAEEVAEARRNAQEFVEKEFTFADQATKQAYINQKAAEARATAQKRIADQAEREANELKRAAEERRKAIAEGIDNNGREEVVATARRFQGMNERTNSGDLQTFFRQNGINVDPEMTAWCAAFVNAVLATNGIKGTGSLAARSFLNFGQEVNAQQAKEGDIVILRRGNNAAQGHVGFFQGFDERGNVRVLGGNQRDGVNTQSFNANDVLGFRRIPSAGQIASEEAKAQEKLLKDQQQFNQALDASVAKRELDTRQLKEQAGLTGNTLLAKQREAAIEDAIAKARADAAKAGIAADDPDLVKRLVVLRQVEGAYFDAAHARDAFENQRQSVQQPVDDLIALRDRIQQQIQFFQERGQTGMADQLQPQLDAVNLKLTEAIEKARTFYSELANNPAAMAALGLTKEQIDAIKLGLDSAALAGQQFGYFMGVSGQTIAQVFAGTATNALDRFAEAVANGGNVFKSLGQAFLQFAADFLRQIAQMIIQQMIFNIVSSALSGGFGGGGGLDTSGGGFNTGGFQFHGGGVIGDASTYGRGSGVIAVDPSWFSTARRYHTGGIAGLRPDEVPAVLKRGEEVLTDSDPRHRANGGGGVSPKITVVNTLDPGEFISKGLGTGPGEQAILNFIRTNSGAVKQALG